MNIPFGSLEKCSGGRALVLGGDLPPSLPQFLSLLHPSFPEPTFTLCAEYSLFSQCHIPTTTVWGNPAVPPGPVASPRHGIVEFEGSLRITATPHSPAILSKDAPHPPVPAVPLYLPSSSSPGTLRKATPSLSSSDGWSGPAAPHPQLRLCYFLECPCISPQRLLNQTFPSWKGKGNLQDADRKSAALSPLAGRLRPFPRPAAEPDGGRQQS